MSSSVQSSTIDAVPRTSPWSCERICMGGAEFFDALVDEIDAARESLELETFIFLPDETGRRVANRIEAAARRGVEVRLMVDGFGSYRFPFDLQPGLEQAGVRTSVFHPLPGHAVLRGRTTTLSKLAGKVARANRRNHRKLAIFDRRVAWTGSRNICDDHNELGDEAWRDTSVRLEGPAVTDLRRSFEYVWRGCPRRSEEEHPSGRFSSRRGEVRAVWLNATSKMRRRVRRELQRRIAEATDRVWLATAYFAPTPKVLRSMLTAADRGTDVRLVVPRESDQELLPWLATSYYRRLLGHGVRVFEFPAHTNLHAKDLVIDDGCIVGSVNLNHRSLLHDLELEVSLFDPRSVETVSEQLRSDMADSTEVDVGVMNRSHRLREMVGTLLRPIQRYM